MRVLVLMVVSLPPCEKQGSAWRELVRKAGVEYSTSARRRRARLFAKCITVKPSDRVLDLGGWDGSHIASLGLDADIFIADVNADAVADGAKKYGFTPVHVPATGRLPFPDDYFDVVFCSSVIEHVTVPEESLRSVTGTRDFKNRALKAQHRFAQEIRRLGKHYFVQTPYRYFPIESHTWMPCVIVALPRRSQIGIIDWANRWWPKPSEPDFHLLNARELHDLFPDATILRERSLGLTKSLMAVR